MTAIGSPLALVRSICERVLVEAAPQSLQNAAAEIGSPPLGRISGWTCDSNSFRLASAAMVASPTSEVRMVGGFAFPFGRDLQLPDSPRAHVWVRIDKKHFDITWPISGPIDRAEYYRVKEFLPEETLGLPNPGVLKFLRQFAEDNQLALVS